MLKYEQGRLNMKKWTKFSNILMGAALLLSLSACSDNSEDTAIEDSTEEEIVTEEGTEEEVAMESVSGSYEVEGSGFGGKMNVKVTVNEDEIEDIEVVDDFETAGVGKVALDIISDRMVEGQSTDVEVVAGATISSRALMSTVRKALDEAGVAEGQFADAYETPRDIQSELEADVVIIGGGGTGLAAAVTAGQEGASVIVLETNGYAGGNLVVSGGVYNSPDPDLQEAQGIEDSPELFKEQTLEGGDNIGDPELVEVMTSQALDGLNWLRDLGVEFDEEVIQAPGALHPRSHNTPEPLGTGIINGYLDAIAEMDNVEVLYETKGDSLIEEDGRIVGVNAVNPDGSDLTLTANNGVIIATGGFSKNAEMVVEYADKEKWTALDENSVSTNLNSITGEGISMSQEIGADVTDMDQMQFLYLGAPNTGLLSGVYDVSAEITIFVNSNGERFVAEDERRDVISSAVFEQENGQMFMLHSADSLSDPATQVNIDGIPMKNLLETGAYDWKQGETLEELAEEMGVPAENLVATVEEYNEAVDSQNDPFGRELLTMKMETGPFYALPRVPSLHHTMGGLRIDTQARVLDQNGNVIPGLYAGGEVTGGIHGANRLGGNAVTETIVFGRVAGLSAAQEK